MKLITIGFREVQQDLVIQNLRITVSRVSKFNKPFRLKQERKIRELLCLDSLSNVAVCCSAIGSTALEWLHSFQTPYSVQSWKPWCFRVSSLGHSCANLNPTPGFGASNTSIQVKTVTTWMCIWILNIQDSRRTGSRTTSLKSLYRITRNSSQSNHRPQILHMNCSCQTDEPYPRSTKLPELTENATRWPWAACRISDRLGARELVAVG